MPKNSYYIIIENRNGEIVFRDGVKDLLKKEPAEVSSEAMARIIKAAMKYKGKYHLFAVNVYGKLVDVIRKHSVEVKISFKIHIDDDHPDGHYLTTEKMTKGVTFTPEQWKIIDQCVRDEMVESGEHENSSVTIIKAGSLFKILNIKLTKKFAI